MPYAVQMASGGTICIPRLIQIGSGVQKLVGGGFYWGFYNLSDDTNHTALVWEMFAIH